MEPVKIVGFGAPAEALYHLPVAVRRELQKGVEWSMGHGLELSHSSNVFGERADTIRRLLSLADVQGVEETDLTGEYVQAVTTAPRAYDGFGTLHLGEVPQPAKYGSNDGRGLVWRRVAMAKPHQRWQDARYGSGAHPCELLTPDGELVNP